jgi:hypothetical protein
MANRAEAQKYLESEGPAMHEHGEKMLEGDPRRIAEGFAGPAAIKLFHGSPEVFTQFLGKGGGQLGRGDYFSPFRDLANRWAHKGIETESGVRTPGTPSVYEVNLKWPDAAKEAADPLGLHHFQKIEFDPNKGRPSMRPRITKIDRNAIGQIGDHFSKNGQVLLKDRSLIADMLRHDAAPLESYEEYIDKVLKGTLK